MNKKHLYLLSFLFIFIQMSQNFFLILSSFLLLNSIDHLPEMLHKLNNRTLFTFILFIGIRMLLLLKLSKYIQLPYNLLSLFLVCSSLLVINISLKNIHFSPISLPYLLFLVYNSPPTQNYPTNLKRFSFSEAPSYWFPPH